MGRRRVLSLLVLVLIIVGSGLAVVIVRSGPHLTPAQLAAEAAARARHRLLVAEQRSALAAEADVAVALPRSDGQRAPGDPPSLYVKPLASHEVVGFVPSWQVGSLSPSDFADATTLVYSAVCVGMNGTLTTAPADCADPEGESTLDSAAFGEFVAAAHAAGDRVLLSAEAVDGGLIHALVAHRAQTAPRLAAALSAIVTAEGLDGVDIDIEGQSGADRAGFTAFVAALAGQLRLAAPEGEILLDALPQSAGTSRGFYDVAHLAPLVDAIFIMAYAMEQPGISSANSPLTSPTLGWSDVQALLQYTRVVPPDKLILGLPFYGLGFTTLTRGAGAVTLGAGPATYPFADVLAAGRPAYWDPASASAYTVFRDGKNWHEDWYDDPVSLAIKTSLAADYRLAGVGAWAFGMEGNDPAMLEALLGGAPPVKLPLVHAGP